MTQLFTDAPELKGMGCILVRQMVPESLVTRIVEDEYCMEGTVCNCHGSAHIRCFNYDSDKNYF